ncbi:MAG TPA: hypothetical protein VK365_05575 [Nocardioidaceae bacterium]|nr:hypothetical protein [Nocardioidaceae bacterium]
MRQAFSTFRAGSWEPGISAVRRLPEPGPVGAAEGLPGSRGDEESGGSGGSVGADFDA